MPGSLYPKHQPDFIAEIEFLPLSETRRKTFPRNGMRLALAYSEDFEAGRYMLSDVWPDFLNDEGNSIPSSVDLKGVYKAEMHILFHEMRDTHFRRLSLNPNFLCTEGRDVLAKGKMISFLKS